MMREDVLKVIDSATDVTNAVILTHNIDFVFVQLVVIPALRKCGSPALTIFADAECAAHTYQSQSRMLSNLGLRYRVVPVAMEPGFRFHPKAVLLSGPKSATLLIGSGNLTFGGWRENGEIWCRYDSATDGTASLAGFHNYLQEVIELCPNAETFRPEIEEAFDPTTRTWASDMEAPDLLLGRAGKGSSMLEQMRDHIELDDTNSLHVCTPYFDGKAEALRAAAIAFGASSTTVLVQNKRTNLNQPAADNLDSTFDLKTTRFVHHDKSRSGDDDNTRDAFLHARFYAVHQGESVIVFAGSANCSRAAIMIPGSSGNAELMTYFSISLDEFEERFLAELVIEDHPPELQSGLSDEPLTMAGQSYIHIRSASIESGVLCVAFQASMGTKIKFADLNGNVLELVAARDTRATFSTLEQPRTIILVGEIDGNEIRSGPHWVDNESSLRASARGRSLAESINQRVRADVWGIDSWTDVLSELHKHLQYMPKAGNHKHTTGGTGDGEGHGPVEFAWEDVFSDSYGLDVGPSAEGRLAAGLEGGVGSLRAMLLRWYGIAQPEPDDDEPDKDIDAVDPDTKLDESDGDGVDRVTELPKATPSKKLPPSTDRQRKKALKLVDQIATILATPEFLSERRPEVLAADLKIAAILLRTGFSEEWLTAQAYFEKTMAIWLPLFFNASGREDTGWLEQRFLTAPDQKAFAESIRSVELAAALGCWALTTPKKATSPEHARFDLASALGVARMPWLWQTGGNQRIAKEISEVFANTSRGAAIDWNQIEDRWLTLIRRGYALDRFEKAVSAVGASELRGQVGQTAIQSGELLWQPPYGFCVSLDAAHLEEGQECDVLILRQGNSIKTFMGPYLLPVAGILDDNLLSEETMPAIAKSVLLTMIFELRIDWSQVR